MNEKPGADLITEERVRQISQEGYTLGHDAGYVKFELVKAAIAYLVTYVHYGSEFAGNNPMASHWWPWDWRIFKPLSNNGNPLRDLVRAGALIAAEIDRIQGMKK